MDNQTGHVVNDCQTWEFDRCRSTWILDAAHIPSQDRRDHIDSLHWRLDPGAEAIFSVVAKESLLLQSLWPRVEARRARIW